MRLDYIPNNLLSLCGELLHRLDCQYPCVSWLPIKLEGDTHGSDVYWFTVSWCIDEAYTFAYRGRIEDLEAPESITEYAQKILTKFSTISGHFLPKNPD